MTWTLEQFHRELYLEHLEEGGFLDLQRVELLDDPELSWVDLADWEARREAHVDALVIGKDAALEVCREQAAGGDPGEMNIAVRVFCRQGRREYLEEVLELLDPEDPEGVLAVARALVEELPPAWETWILELLTSEEPAILQVAARVTGHRRLAGSEALLEQLTRDPRGPAASEVIRALGRLLEPRARWPLAERLPAEESPLAGEIYETLARLGEEIVTTDVRDRALTGAERDLWRGWTGGRDAVTVLHERATDGEAPSAAAVLALGLLGDVSAVDYLIDAALLDDDLAPSAALALEALSGARLSEEVWIPEEEEDDGDEEGEDSGEGAPEPIAGAEKPPARGEMVVRPCQDPKRWRAWWNEHGKELRPTRRHRGGRQITPLVLAEELLDAATPHALREAAARELVVCYGCPHHFERDDPVALQVRSIAGLRRWAEQQEGKFEAGRWYLGGRRID